MPLPIVRQRNFPMERGGSGDPPRQSQSCAVVTGQSALARRGLSRIGEHSSCLKRRPDYLGPPAKSWARLRLLVSSHVPPPLTPAAAFGM
jgi:hypothetical protein